jgi:hypothetical protein
MYHHKYIIDLQIGELLGKGKVQLVAYKGR